MKELAHITGTKHFIGNILNREGTVPAFYKRQPKATTMKNLTLCEGKDAKCICPIREHCFRHTAKPDPHYQAWFVQLPFNFEKEKCDCFLPVNKVKQARPLGWLFQMH